MGIWPLLNYWSNTKLLWFVRNQSYLLFKEKCIHLELFLMNLRFMNCCIMIHSSKFNKTAKLATHTQDLFLVWSLWCNNHVTKQPLPFLCWMFSHLIFTTYRCCFCFVFSGLRASSRSSLRSSSPTRPGTASTSLSHYWEPNTSSSLRFL